MLPNRDVNPGDMTSFNHYAFGSVAGWVHSFIAGLKPLTPGWRVFAVEPVPDGGLKWAEGKCTSCYGERAVRWKIIEDETPGEPGRLWVHVKVPPNSTKGKIRRCYC